MKQLVCTIHDSSAKTYHQPFFTPNQATAQREFLRLIRDETSAVHAFPSDYSLWEIAEFDTDTGVISEFSQIQNITP
ncbi:MAG: nonstructural protein [Arizlama microvirus]|nr:MAG: nonstructural protein [Arizlama microvirus]